MLSQIFQYLRHWLKASTRYAVHSPFVYDFVTQVLPHKDSAQGPAIDNLRKQLSKSDESIEIEDLGAGYGGKEKPQARKKIKEVVASSARKRRNGELLHRICLKYAPKNCLELGTNLGFSTLYQATAVPESRFTTIEGAPELAKKAQLHFTQFGITVDQRVGEFDQILEELLQEGTKFDYVLLDGNHKYDATVKYFELLEDQMNEGGIVIVDDINWSKGMQKAWKCIQRKDSVSLSIDLYWMGICFLHREQAKQAFRFRFRP